MNLEDFLPTYPGYEIDPLFSVYQDELTAVIQRKKEFLELTLDESEPRPEKSGDLLKHQLFLRRFMSGHTPYNGILLWHAVGTGKTGSAIAVAEGLKHFNDSFLKTLILVRSNTFIRNFKNEIAYVMTAGEYLPPNIDSLTEGEKTRRINKLIGDYYEFNTFQVFARQYINTASKERFIKQYSNRLIIIDEVHNIRKTESGTYDAIHDFLHRVKDCKTVLLTATPIKDQASEFASVMNLILPPSTQLPTGLDFMNAYFRDWDKSIDELAALRIDTAQRKALIEAVKGRISYLQPTRSDVQVINAGQQLPTSPFPQVLCPMSEHQAKIFSVSYDAEIKKEVGSEEDEDEKDDAVKDGADRASSLYTRSIQDSLCVSDSVPFKKSKLVSIIKPSKEKLEVVKKYSAKYHYILQHILANPSHNSFIYCTDVVGAGIETLQEIFVNLGFSEVTDNKSLSVPSKRFAVITGKSVEGFTENVLREYNQPKNKYGQYIQVIIGSAAIGEGRSLLSVRDIFIATPHWNLTDMDQAIGRGIRFGSHRYLNSGERTVTIHRLRAVAPDGKSIDDYITRVAYGKDLLSKKIEAVARTAAIDCDFNFVRNRQNALDGSRQCLYQECEYTCAVPRGEEKEIEDTYNLFYTEKEYQAIRRHLQEIFCRKFKYLVRDILAHRQVRVYSSIVVLRSITSIIERREVFTNPLGFPSYLKERKGMLILCHDASAPADPAYDYDTKIGQTYPVAGFKEFLENFELQNLDAQLSLISERLGEPELAKTLFNQFPDRLRLEILRQCLPVSRQDTPLIKFIQKEMRQSYNETEDGIEIEDMNEVYVFSLERWMPLIKDFSPSAFNDKLLRTGLAYYGIMANKSFKLIRLDDRVGFVPTSLLAELLKKILDDTLEYYLGTLTKKVRSKVVLEAEEIVSQGVKEPLIDYIKLLLSNLGLILTDDKNRIFMEWRSSLKDGIPR